MPDASRIRRRDARGTRAGHDISVEVRSMPACRWTPWNRALTMSRSSAPKPARRSSGCGTRPVIPNKDFILKYDVAGRRVEDAVLTHSGRVLHPDAAAARARQLEEITPKELVFVLDTSGSMSGFPIEKAKEAMRLALDGLHPRDTFNLITFSGDTHILFPEPVPATPENVRTGAASF